MINTSFKFRYLHIWAVILTAASFTSLLVAQIAKPGYDDKLLFRGATGVTVGAVSQQWTLSDSGTYRQFAFPISVSVPITSRMLFSLTNAGASTRSNGASVAGFVDTRLSLSYVLPGDKIWLTGGASFPTGKTELDIPELNLAKYLSQAAFSYKVPMFGQGFSGNGGITYATAFTRRLVFGLGMSFYYRGTYEPIKLSNDSLLLEYNPGDELSVNMGIDFITYSKAARFSFDVTGTYFFEDQLSGKTIFQSGPRATATIIYSLRTGSYNHQLTARMRYRLQNTYYNADTTSKYDAAVHVEGQYAVTYPLNEWLVGTGVGEIKYYTADQLPFAGSIIKTGNAEIGSVGADFLFVVSELFSPTVTVRYSFGTITIDDHPFTVNGFEAGIGIKVSF